MKLLEKEKIKKHRAVYGDYKMKHPTDEQWGKYKQMFFETTVLTNENRIQGGLTADAVRLILKELVGIEDIDDISDEKLDDLQRYGSKDFKNILREIKEMLIEMATEFQEEQYNSVMVIDTYANTMRTNLELDNIKTKMNKAFKKQGMDLTFEELISMASSNPELLEEKLKDCRVSNKTRKVNKKKK